MSIATGLRAAGPQRRPHRTALHRAAVCAVLLSAFAAQAQDGAPLPAAADLPASRQPLWEVGIAAGFGTVPDYPASDRYRAQVVPFPYFVYRGSFFRADDNGTRLRADVRPNVELDVSGGASFAAHSDPSGPRAGMPDLDYLLELGPNLKVTFARPSPNTRWLVEFPLRAVISTNGGNLGYQGLVSTPNAGIHSRSVLGSRWNAYANIGPEFTSSRFQKYFFQVDPQFALPNRPAYVAHGGYLGSRLEIGLTRKIGRDFRLFFYNRLDDYAGSENASSPLFKSHLGYTAFTGISWAVWHSKDTVPMSTDNP